MRWLIYWTFYSSSLGDKDIAGVITVTDTTITTYALGYQYITWEILEKKQKLEDNRIIYGEYFLERNQIKSYLVITRKSVNQYIATEPGVHIKLTRKWEFRPK
jgi:hypothetical protein